MTKFIELTELTGDKFYINVAKIEAVSTYKDSLRDETTRVTMDGSYNSYSYYEVQESAEEVLVRINT